MNPIDQIDDKKYTSENWTDENGNHQGGQSFGPGFCIAWQRGPIIRDGETTQNGALLITVLSAAADQIRYFQNSKFSSSDNEEALANLEACISCLERRKQRRKSEGKLGTHKA